MLVVHGGCEIGDDVGATLHQRLGSSRHVLHLGVIQDPPLLLSRDQICLFHLKETKEEVTSTVFTRRELETMEPLQEENFILTWIPQLLKQNMNK